MSLDQWRTPDGAAASPGHSDKTYQRGYGWSLVIGFTAASVVLNGAHAVLGMASHSGLEQSLSAAVAVVAPVSLLLATHLVVGLIRDWSHRRRWVTRLRALCATTTVGIGLIAFATSFVALMDMAELMGVAAGLTWALPAVVDAMIIIATLAVVVAEAEMALDRAEAAVGAQPTEAVVPAAEEVARDESREFVPLTAHGTDGVPSDDVPKAVTPGVPPPGVSWAVPPQDETAVTAHGTDGVPAQRDRAAQVLDQGEQKAVPLVQEAAPEGVPPVPADDVPVDVPSQVDEIVPNVTAHDEQVGRADEARYSDTPAVPVRLHVVPGDGVPTHGGDTAKRAGAVVEQFRPDVSTEVVAQMITARRGGASYRELAELAGISANTARRWMLSVGVDVESESTG